MALPILQVPIHSITLPVSKKIIEIKPFVIKEEKSLLTSINTENKEEILKIFNILIENCVVTKDFNIKELNMVDFFYLILSIRMKSTGEEIEGSLKCKYCKKNTLFAVNLEESLKFENINKEIETVSVNDKLVVQMILPNINLLFENDKLEVIDLICSSIKSIVYEEIVYNDFTIKEFKENILFNLTNQEIKKISDGLERLPKIKIAFKFICTNCGKENEFETEEIIDFF